MIENSVFQDAPFKKFIYNIDLDMFRDVKVLNTPSFDAFHDTSNERPLLFKKIEGNDGEVVDTRWIVLENGDVRKCEWKDGQATFSRGDPREFPLILTKSLVTDFFKVSFVSCAPKYSEFQGKLVNTDLGFFIDRDGLSQCLEYSETCSYDYVGPLPEKGLLIFKKTEMKHICKGNSNDGCECIEEILHVYFVSEIEGVVHITWGADEDRFLSFNNFSDPNDVPPVLKTKNALHFLLLVSFLSLTEDNFSLPV